MSLTVQHAKCPLLALTENLIAVEASADQRLLAEARKTADVKSREAEKAKKVIAEQAAENASLKAQLVQLKAQMEQLKVAHAAMWSAERQKLITSINAQQSHITYLGGRVDRHVIEVNILRDIFFYRPEINLAEVHASLERAHNIG